MRITTFEYTVKVAETTQIRILKVQASKTVTFSISNDFRGSSQWTLDKKDMLAFRDLLNTVLEDWEAK